MNLKKYKKLFFLNNSSPKIKHETLCNDYKAGGLKNVDILSKIIALQCCWIRRLYENYFHEWKLIPLYLIEKSFGTAFKFHSNLLFKGNKIKFFPSFYSQIILNWKKCLAMITEVPSCILSQYLWFNRSIQVDNFSVYFLKFSTEIYPILIARGKNKPSSNIYFENLYNDYNIDWTAISNLLRLITNNTYMRSFQYKILNNVLFLNKKLYTFGIKPSPLCSFCNLYDETPYHMFYECDLVKCLWSGLVQCFQNNLIIPTLTPQTTIFRFLDYMNNDSFLKTINASATTFH